MQWKKLAAKRISLTWASWLNSWCAVLAHLILTIIAILLHGSNRICMCNDLSFFLSRDQASTSTPSAVSYQLFFFSFNFFVCLFIVRRSFSFVAWIKLCGLHQSQNVIWRLLMHTRVSFSVDVHKIYTHSFLANSLRCFYRLFNSFYLESRVYIIRV